MKKYISTKSFYTKGIREDNTITIGVIPGLEFILIGKDQDDIVLQNANTGSRIVVTESMLNSSLFIEMEEVNRGDKEDGENNI